MSVEDTLFTTLGPLCANRVYPLKAPEGATKPYITYQQVSGIANNFLENALPGLRNAVFQINCWATTPAAAKSLAFSVEQSLITSSTLQANVQGALSDGYDEVAKLYGTRQDFSVWS